MTAQSRDTQILEKIQGYCNDIMFTHTEYAHDYHTFCTNPTYRNDISHTPDGAPGDTGM